MFRFAALTAISAVSLVSAQAAEPSSNPVQTGKAAFGDWHDDLPTAKRLFRPGDMPKPFVTKSVSNRADKAKMPAGAKPLVPEGFSVELVASGIKNPRALRVAPNGDLFIADSRANQILVYRFGNAAGAPVEKSVYAKNLSQPYGMAFYPPTGEPEWVYVANSNSVVRFPYSSGDLTASAEPETIVADIPSSGHWTRDIVFSPDGKTMYLAVGSASNVAQDLARAPAAGLDEWIRTQPLGAVWSAEEGRADVLSFTPDGKNRKIFATGLRNCSGMAMQPETGAPWCVVNERDGLGDNVPFEYATAVKDGAFYGWPWYYIGGNEDPRHAGRRPDLASRVTVPDVLLQPHSAPLGIAFYQGPQFPADYNGDAFVAMHGSWNRGIRTGYKVVRLHFDGGKPTGEYEDFMTGFVISDSEVWGRPVGVAVSKDGSLLVSEDGSGTLWRVSHVVTSQ